MSTNLSQYALDPAREELGLKVHAALESMLPEGAKLSLDARTVGQLFEKPPETAMGDFALPCFRFAKDLRLKPQDVAAQLATKLAAGGWLARTQVVGAFLNIFVDQTHMAQAVLPNILSEKAFKRLAMTPANISQRVMIEYSQPNTLKEFHVGHARNVCLGNALVRLFRYCGYKVTAANYFGDDGTHISAVLWYLRENNLEAPAEGRDEWFGQMYAKARQTLDQADETEKARIQAEMSKIHRAVERREGDVYKLWEETREQSLETFHDIYNWLNVHFDTLFYESEMTDEAQAIVNEYLTKGLFELDKGAVGVDLKPHKLGYCILRKSDGNTLYATKDLALARRKFEAFGIDRNIYVVADEQNHHFRQVFKVLELMGFEKAKLCHHLSYGMVMLPEGKMSSRAGTAVTFSQLRREMLEHLGRILAKYENEWSAEEIKEAAHKLCDGAIKYGMVSTDPVKEIVFNLEDWLSFEGHSGPYLMYSYTRTKSILRKAKEAGADGSSHDVDQLTSASEHDLLRHLYDFNDVVAVSCESYRPSHLASHLFHMCKAFNRFYADTPVLKAETEALRSARLALIEAFALTLKEGLSLIGITPPERM